MKPNRILVVLLLASVLSACGDTGTSEDPGAESQLPADVENGQSIVNSAPCDAAKPATCAGADMPSFLLEDFQPESPYNGETYGLDRFQGKVTYVSLWAAWCGYCRSQAHQMQLIHEELQTAGVAVNVVAVNIPTGVDQQSFLADECDFPLLQDTDEVNAWGLMNGGKDDMFVYDADGKLLVYLPAQGDVETHLSTPQGYANIRDILLFAAGGPLATDGTAAE